MPRGERAEGSRQTVPHTPELNTSNLPLVAVPSASLTSPSSWHSVAVQGEEIIKYAT